MSVLHRPVLPLVTALTALALVGCSSSAADTSTAAAADEPAVRVVTTDQGDVEVPADPQRVVVLNSALAGYFFALDVPVHATIPETPGPGGGEYPETWAEEATEADTVVLPWGEDGFDLEAIVAEDPDLIVGGGQGYPAKLVGDVYGQLSEIAPTVVVSSTLTTWQDQLSFLAEEVLDRPAEEQELLDRYDARVAEVKAAITLPPTPVGYLMMAANGAPYSLPETSQLPQTLAEVGLEPAPVIADNPEFETYGTGDSFAVSPELVGQVLTAPTVIVLGFNADVTDAATLAADPIYAGLPAFAAENAHDLPYWAYRADFYRTMDLLDVIESEFS